MSSCATIAQNGRAKTSARKGLAVFNCVPRAGLSHVRPIGMRLSVQCEHASETPLVRSGMAQADPAETVSGRRRYALARPSSALERHCIAGRDVGFAESGFRPPSESQSYQFVVYLSR